MVTNTEQILVEKFRGLPLSEQEKVLDFVTNLETTLSSSKCRTIWEKVESIINEVPSDNWEELPKDGSINVDHYLYNTPKK